jgi:hypothetical protein
MILETLKSQLKVEVNVSQNSPRILQARLIYGLQEYYVLGILGGKSSVSGP